MNISDFAKQRNVESQAVSRYISRHPEIKEHTVRKGKEVELLPEAERLLDEVYPVPKPVQVLQGVDPKEHEALQKKYQALLERMNLIQEERIKDKELIAKAETAQILLEDKKKQLEAAENKLSIEISERKTVELHLAEAEKATMEAEKATLEAKKATLEAEQEIERLKNRSLWERIRNK